MGFCRSRFATKLIKHWRLIAVLAICAVVWQTMQQDQTKIRVEVKLDLPKELYTCPPMRIPQGSTVQPWKGPRQPLIVPVGTRNIALKKKVTSSDNGPSIGSLDMVTDGDKDPLDSWVSLGGGTQWVQIDLGERATIYGLLMWHNHGLPRVYRDVIIQISDDRDFKLRVVTVFNNDQDNSSKLGAGKDVEYFESAEGLLVDCQKIDPKGVKGRYVRCYSNGNISDPENDYVEVEVYGKLPG